MRIVLTLCCWTYLTMIGWLLLWVAVPAALFGLQPIALTSDSMAPRIRTGDVILARPHHGLGLEPGAVITYARPGDPNGRVTHRIVRINEDGTYRTRGDANPVPDSTPVSPEAVESVGRLVVPALGLPTVWLLSGQAHLIALWLAATTFSTLNVRTDAIGRSLLYAPGTWSIRLDR